MNGGTKALLIGTAAAAAVTTTATSTNTSTTTTTSSSSRNGGGGSDPSPTPTPSPPPTAITIPSGYLIRNASEFGVACDGVKDDTAALRAALSGIKSYQALVLPAGTCLTTNTLSLYNKSNVFVVGAGKDSTIIQAQNPQYSSFVVSTDTNVTLGGFQVYSPNSTTRINNALGRGVYVEKSNGVTIDGVKVRKTAGAGILLWIVQNSKVLNSDVLQNLSDAFHVTGGSQNVLFQYNNAQGSGDDCFASIGYGAAINHNIQFLDNSCADNKASGVSFEGTVGGAAYRNKLTRTGVSAIRVASIASYKTGYVSDIDVRYNVLTDVKTRTDVDHAAIMVFASYQSVQNVNFEANSIIDPRTRHGVRMLNYSPTTLLVNNISFDDTTNTSANLVEKKCFAVGTGITNLQLATNTLNSQPCEAH